MKVQEARKQLLMIKSSYVQLKLICKFFLSYVKHHIENLLYRWCFHLRLSSRESNLYTGGSSSWRLCTRSLMTSCRPGCINKVTPAIFASRDLSTQTTLWGSTAEWREVVEASASWYGASPALDWPRWLALALWFLAWHGIARRWRRQRWQLRHIVEPRAQVELAVGWGRYRWRAERFWRRWDAGWWWIHSQPS